MQEKQVQRGGSRGVTRVVAAVLTVAFFGFIFLTFTMMMRENGQAIVNSALRKSEVKAYLPSHWDALDVVKASVASFTAKISDVMWRKREMGQINSTFQLCLGKRVIVTGSASMICLNGGYYYDLCEYVDPQPKLKRYAAFREKHKDIPFLFVYEHPKLYDPDAMMPADYAAMDHTVELADEIVSFMRDNGIPCLDTRDILNNSGVPLPELLLRTDQHWSPRAAMLVTQSIAEELNSLTGATLDPSLLDIGQFDATVHKEINLGNFGGRLGVRRITPDDIIEYIPKYETHYTRVGEKNGKTEHVRGSFSDVAMDRTRLVRNSEGYNTMAYALYGYTEPYNIFLNEDAADCTVLLLKDSYSSSVASFLSLVAKDVVSVDLRYDRYGVENWIERYHPDAIVMAFSLPMIVRSDYKL